MEKKQYRSPFFTSKEQSGLRVSADKERTQGALLWRGVFLLLKNKLDGRMNNMV